MKQPTLRKQIMQSISGIIFPPKCPCCLETLPPQYRYCDVCAAELPRITGKICPVCGAGADVCNCRQKARLFDGNVSPFYHADGIRMAMNRFKFEERLAFGVLFAQEMANTVRERLPSVAFDVVTFVPMSKSEYRNRGYYPAKILAKELALELNLPFDTLLCKILETKAQRTLSIRQRSGNVLGAFESVDGAEERIRGKHILLCDDVMTTGSTLNECAKMLKIAGAETVYTVTPVKTALKSRLTGRELTQEQTPEQILDEEDIAVMKEV